MTAIAASSLKILCGQHLFFNRRSLSVGLQHCYATAAFKQKTCNNSTYEQLNCKSKSFVTHSGNINANSNSWHWLMKSMLVSCGLGVFLWKKQSVKCAVVQHASVPDKKWKDLSIKLYQYQTCPFCSKTRYFLQAYNIPFEMIEVHPLFKKEISFAESKKVPIVVLEQDGKTQVLQDSSLIISVLGSYMVNSDKSIEELAQSYPRKSITNDSGDKREEILNRHWLIHIESEEETKAIRNDPRKEEAEWRMWADDYLVHIISPNVYRSLREAYQAFDYHVKQGRFNGTWEGFLAKFVGAGAMWMISKKLKKKYDLSDDVRLDLYKACNKWIDAIGKDRKFMGGDKPNLADISVFGVLSVMEGLDSFQDLLTYSKIKRWYFRTKEAIQDHNAQSLLLVK